MAIAVASSSTNLGTNVGSIVITKPTGLAVGEVMVAIVCDVDTVSPGGTYTAPAGWTAAVNDTQDILGLAIFYKVADSGDVAASNFTFTQSGGSIIGGILRVTGLDTVNLPEFEVLSKSATNASSYSITIAEASRVPSYLLIVAGVAELTTSPGGSIALTLTTTPSVTLTNFFSKTAGNSNELIANIGYVIETSDTIKSFTAHGGTCTNTMDNGMFALAAFRELYPTSGNSTLLNNTGHLLPDGVGSNGASSTSASLVTSPEFTTSVGESGQPTPWTTVIKS